jgi:D-glycero-D-manno-heptose 1,7-bisphosphate phosphatase
VSCRAAVFLDRDGTVNQEVSYLPRMDRLSLIPGAAAAIRRLRAAGFSCIVVTNQSGVARGFFSKRTLQRIHGRLRRMLRRAGTRLDGIFSCIRHPHAVKKRYRAASDWRKPAPGMLQAAAVLYGISLPDSFMVGDRWVDIEAGRRAGCQTVLVRTGYGENTLGEKPPVGCVPDFVAADLAAAADWILANKAVVHAD